jgi:hypothetical protein
VNEPDDTQGLGPERNAYTAGSDASPVNGFSFSQVSVLGLQRKCACGGVAGPTGECTECRRKRALGLQPKLTVNQPGDAYEREADRAAQAMMGSFSYPLQPRSEQETDFDYPAESALTKGGERLSPDVTDFYETRFGHDFSAVRVHTGETAMRYNDAVNAYAFTYGSHIWLGPDLQPRPSHILAHELAHVVQQTQPPPLEAEPNQPASSPSRQSVQRYQPYWTPRNKRFDTHRFILPKIGAENSVFTEAPVPNANRKVTGEGGEVIEGRADLYKAEKAGNEAKTVGVWFAGDRSPKNLPAPSQLQYGGKSFVRLHATQSAPQADEAKGSVIRARLAPDHIWLGELKPSHGSEEAHEGRKQLDNYRVGFETAQTGVNTMPADKTDADWPELKILPIKVKIPDMFESPSDTNQPSRELMIVQNGVIYHPLTPVMGKVHVAESPPPGGDILNYTWEPDSAVSVTARRVGHVRGARMRVRGLGELVTADLVRPLRQSPIRAARKAKPAPPIASLTPAPRRIQARERGTATEDVKDPFDQAAFDKWKADHRRLSGTEKPQLEKTDEFKEAKIESLAIEDRQAAIKSGFKFPAISPEEKEHVKTLDQIEFWTNPRTAILGKLRYHFGGIFVKVVNAYHSIRARFQKLLEEKKVAPKSGGLLGTIIRIAFAVLKTAGRVIVGRTAQHLTNSLTTGVKQKLESLIPQDKLEEFEAKVQEIEALADDLERRAVETVEDLVKETVGPYEILIETISEAAHKLSTFSEVVSKVRWGARVIACLSPPGWGCLWILAESVIEKFASWLIDKCWFKKEITPLVTSVGGFISTLPVELAKLIVDGIKGFLPSQLRDVFADIKPEQISTDIPSHEICDENDYPTTRDRDLVERLALAELRKEIGEEKWQAWIKLAELYGVNRGQPLSLERISQLKKELKKADLAALREAADMHTAMPPGGDVVNLTTFLEEVERVKQQMYGVGPGGQGGQAGIQIPAAEKDLPGAYNLSFKFQVVGGVNAGDYQGAVINVDFADMIKGTLVTLEDVEVVVRKRVFIPNERNPERMEVDLEVTKDQYFDVEQKYGTAFVDKIRVKRFRVSKGNKKRYTLQLRAGKPGQ